MAINKPKKLTPMLIQYYTIKEQNQDSLLFFRLGDFYELFGEDAVVAHKILGITLTARNKGTENEIPMCGVPHHSSENYIAKLIRAGKKVAICEQVSDPSEKGIVERKVVRIITPGTTLQESILEEKQNNFLLAFVERKNQCGVAYCDLSTGEMKATEIHNTKEAFEEIARVSPAEIILDSENIVFTELHSITPNISLYNESDDAKKTLQEHFSLQDISVFGLESKALGLQAASNLLSYLKTTQKTQLDQIQKISSYTIHDYMMLDTQTLRNLEIL
ncbi:MAG: hypothetical protein U9Q15_01850 [Patescibacteria group bacterium]|nr:hypothetical protein [Patescibacteria group bacterium]